MRYPEHLLRLPNATLTRASSTALPVSTRPHRRHIAITHYHQARLRES